MPISPSPAVLRACEILDHLARRPNDSSTVSEIARRVGVPRATCDSLLLALADKGLVSRSEQDRRYSLGPAGIAIGDAARRANAVVTAASTEARLLAERLSCCVAVAARIGDAAEVVEIFDFGPPFGVRAQVGHAIPLAPPFGAVFIAWSSEESVDRWLHRADPPLTAKQQKEYRSALTEIRSRGYSAMTFVTPDASFLQSLDNLVRPAERDREAQRAHLELLREITQGERLVGAIDDDSRVHISQVSAPIFDPAGTVNGEIVVLGPLSDVTGIQLQILGAELCASLERAATRITRNASASRPAPVELHDLG
jgi:DNA-binding IclR family transcriptional regulator